MTSPKSEKSKASPATVERPEPSQREQAAIEAAKSKLRTKPRSVALIIEKSADGQLNASPPHKDGIGWLLHLAGTFGSSSADFALDQLNLLMKSTRADLSPEGRTTAVNSMLAAVAGVQAQTETEGALAVQMAATHQLAMTLLERAGQAQHGSVLESNGNMAVKLLRTYTAQVEALARLRRGGNQMVRVEHVHVHSGGQAIVGHVAHQGGGGGNERNAAQPHAPQPEVSEPRRLTAEPVAPLRSENTQREPVPVTRGDWTEAMPDAWWRKG